MAKNNELRKTNEVVIIGRQFDFAIININIFSEKFGFHQNKDKQKKALRNWSLFFLKR